MLGMRVLAGVARSWLEYELELLEPGETSIGSSNSFIDDRCGMYARMLDIGSPISNRYQEYMFSISGRY